MFIVFPVVKSTCFSLSLSFFLSLSLHSLSPLPPSLYLSISLSLFLSPSFSLSRARSLSSNFPLQTQCVTERESWILGNVDNDSSLSAVDNARMVEPGFEMMTPEQQDKARTRSLCLDSNYACHLQVRYV